MADQMSSNRNALAEGFISNAPRKPRPSVCTFQFSLAFGGFSGGKAVVRRMCSEPKVHDHHPFCRNLMIPPLVLVGLIQTLWH